MLDERKADILRAVVQEYIQTGQPVGSQHVARAGAVQVSPATVRNEMSVLEREGFLVQPHTSAGRVPTDKGYRFFVDQLTGPGRLAPPQRQLVRDFFNSAHGELEAMLHDTSQLLSRLTSYAAVVIGLPHETACIRSVQIVGLAPRVALVVVVLSNGAVDKHTIELDDDLNDTHLAAAGAHLARQVSGRALGALGSVAPTGDPRLDRVADQVAAAFSGADADDDEHVWVGGASRMAAAFDAVETVRSVLATLEQQYVVVTLLRNVLDRGLSVAIGTEHGVEPLAECAVVVAPYEMEGERTGTIGVLGPTRMNYPQALAAVADVSERLGRRLSDG